jgi:riboflavin-specific deaminase-like protein
MNQPQIRRPSVTIHYAQTLDGRIATRTGQSQWVSGEESLRLAHQLRAAHQAILVGVGTVLTDNPRLTVRLVPGRSPCRVIADSTLRLPLDAHVLTDRAAKTIVATTARAPENGIEAIRERGAEILIVKQDSAGQVSLCDLLPRLAARGIESVLIEGGQGLITAALRERLADRLVVCIAPKVMGSGIEAVGELNISRLSEAVTFANASFAPLGEDVIFDGQIVHAPGRSD